MLYKGLTTNFSFASQMFWPSNHDAIVMDPASQRTLSENTPVKVLSAEGIVMSELLNRCIGIGVSSNIRPIILADALELKD
jgi:hypothetical protein